MEKNFQMLNHEPHKTTRTLAQIRGVVPFVCPPSDPRLRRALEAWPPRVSVARAGSASELAAPSQARTRSDSSDWVVASGFGTKDHYGAHVCRSSRTPVGKRGSVEQARLQNRDLRRPPGRRMPDGWTRQRPRTAVPKRLQDYYHGDSLFVWFSGVRGYSQTSYGLKAGSATRRTCG